jgi:hypothetical protein
MRRHSAIFLLREATTSEQRLAMLRGLAFLRMECATVVAGDYGEALDTRSPAQGAYDVALHLDFADAVDYAAYVADPTHVAVSAFNASLSVAPRTARIDWDYDGPPPNRRGGIRHCVLFTWALDADPGAREHALAAARRLAEAPTVESLVIGADVGEDPRAADWALDVQMPDVDSARSLLASDVYAQAMDTIAAATRPEETARITHLMRGC